MRAGPPQLEAHGVEVEIGGVRILRRADLTLDRGELVAIVGPNGAGKSTFVRAVSGLQPFSAGDVRWSGRVLPGLRGRELAHLRAFVPQRMPVPAGVGVREAVTIGRSSHLRPLRRLQGEDREAIEAAMERAGATPFAARPLTTLSGGEFQRVQIAIGLAQQAPVLIADEPTSQLDLGRDRDAAARPRRRGARGPARRPRPGAGDRGSRPGRGRLRRQDRRHRLARGGAHRRPPRRDLGRRRAPDGRGRTDRVAGGLAAGEGEEAR
jgi:ABC-type Mn2+/Zn2+ transport system ATPase subunit